MAAKRSTAGQGTSATPARGRPRRSAAQAADVRARVIDVARELFAAEGFEAVSVRRIADAAGCPAMTLYGYFRSKNDILRHIWDDFFGELFEGIAAATTRGTPQARLRRACTLYVDYWCEHPDRYRMVFLNQDRGERGEALYVDSSNIVDRFGAIRTWIEAMQADGSGRAGDPQQLGEALVCALIGITHALLTIPEYRWQPRKQLLRTCFAIVDAA